MADTSKKAQLSFISSISHLLKEGYEVAVPLNHSSEVDLVVRKLLPGYQWCNVQIKSFYQDRSSVVANVCRTNATGRTPYLGIDMFALVDGNEVILLNWKDLHGRTRVALSTAKIMQAKRDEQLSMFPGE